MFGNNLKERLPYDMIFEGGFMSVSMGKIMTQVLEAGDLNLSQLGHRSSAIIAIK